MVKKNNKKLGNLGEDIVVKYIKKYKGWKILGRNFNYKTGELDIIAKDKNTIIFVEVKASSKESAKHFKPEDHFNYKKVNNFTKTAQAYLMKNNYSADTDYRIDLAALEINKETRIARLRYYKNAVG